MGKMGKKAKKLAVVTEVIVVTPSIQKDMDKVVEAFKPTEEKVAEPTEAPAEVKTEKLMNPTK